MRRGIGDSANFLKLRNNKPVVKSKSLIPRRVLTNRSCFAKEQKPVSMCVKLGSFVVARTYRLLPKVFISFYIKSTVPLENDSESHFLRKKNVLS